MSGAMRIDSARRRYIAHTMRRRGTPLDAIAEHLKVEKRSVTRYLAHPCPEAPPGLDEPVKLDDFIWRGACAGQGDVMFREDPAGIAAAKRFCAGCPVMSECRSYGLTTGKHDVGVWGGLSEEERRAALRRKPRAA